MNCLAFSNDCACSKGSAAAESDDPDALNIWSITRCRSPVLDGISELIVVLGSPSCNPGDKIIGDIKGIDSSSLVGHAAGCGDVIANPFSGGGISANAANRAVWLVSADDAPEVSPVLKENAGNWDCSVKDRPVNQCHPIPPRTASKSIDATRTGDAILPQNRHRQKSCLGELSIHTESLRI